MLLSLLFLLLYNMIELFVLIISGPIISTLYLLIIRAVNCNTVPSHSSCFSFPNILRSQHRDKEIHLLGLHNTTTWLRYGQEPLKLNPIQRHKPVKPSPDYQLSSQPNYVVLRKLKKEKEKGKKHPLPSHDEYGAAVMDQCSWVISCSS